MLILAMGASLPETMWGWVAVIGTVVATTVIVGRVVIGLARAHINRRIELTMEDSTKEAVDECLKPIDVKIDGLVGDSKSALDRVGALEVTINNGLTHSTEQTMQDVESIKTTIGGMQIKLAEMYVWMKATHELAWDGSTERRT
jgi:hypothetical protein